MPPTKPSERLLTYPPMERQDLNQAQLGSFKFTPVDNIHSLTSIATKYLNQQLAQNLARASTPRTSDRTLNASLGKHNVDVASQLPNTQNHPPRTDPEFFNAHIKPHLGESRLQLGPAALRSAVEGAARSPAKKPRLEFEGIPVSSFPSTSLTSFTCSSQPLSTDQSFRQSLSSRIKARTWTQMLLPLYLPQPCPAQFSLRRPPVSITPTPRLSISLCAWPW